MRYISVFMYRYGIICRRKRRIDNFKNRDRRFFICGNSNIDKYIKRKRKLRRANSDYNADIYKTAGISDNSVLDLDYDLSTVRKMVLYEIKRTKVIAGTSQDDSSYDDLLGNKYMSASVVVYQDSLLDKYRSNGTRDSYGFYVYTNMKWEKTPLTRSKDFFAISWNNWVMRAVNSSTVSTAACYDENGEIWRHAEAGANIKYSGSINSAQTGSSYYKYSKDVERYIESNVTESSSGLCYQFKLPSNVASNEISIRYDDFEIEGRHVLWSNRSFNIYIGYAHRQLLTDNIKASISLDGMISFSSLGAGKAYFPKNPVVVTI